MTGNFLEILIRTSLVYFVPLFIGRAIYMMFAKRKKSLVFQIKHKVYNEPIFLHAPYYFSLGLLFILLYGLLSWYIFVGLFNFSFNSVFFYPILGLFILSVFYNFFFISLKIFRVIQDQWFPYFIIALLSIVVANIWWIQNPYLLNWDWYQHQLLVNLILDGKFSYFTSNLSDTFGFDSYPPTVHILMAISQFLSVETPSFFVDYWRILSFFHLMLVGVSSWVIGEVVSRERYVGFFSAVIGILVFDSSVSFTNLFFLPQTLAATLFVFLFAKLLLKIRNKKTLKWQFTLVALLVLPLTHYVVGSFGAILFLAFDLYSRILRHKKIPSLEMLPIVQVVISLAVIGILASQFIDFSYLNSGEAALYIFDLSEKQGFAEHAYGYSLYIFLSLGIGYAITHKKRLVMINLLILFGYLCVVLAKFPYVLKYYTLGRYWIHLFMALGIWSVVKTIHTRLLRGVIAVSTIVTFVGILIINVYYWKAGLLYQNTYTHISKYDFELAEFFTNLDQEEVFVVSDPSTQFLLETFSGADTPGGAYMTLPNRRNLYLGTLPRADWEAENYLISIKDSLSTHFTKETYYVFSGRTFVWLNSDQEQRNVFNYNIWTPTDLSVEDWGEVIRLENLPHFERVYHSPYAVVLKFTPRIN